MIIIQHYTAGYSTIPEESRKACNMPPQYGFEHVIYRFYPLCGSKVLLEEVLQSCTEPGLWWKPVKDKNGQNTPHFSEKINNNLLHTSCYSPFLNGPSAWGCHKHKGGAQCGFVARSYLLDAETSRLSIVPAIVVDQHEKMGDCPRLLYCTLKKMKSQLR